MISMLLLAALEFYACLPYERPAMIHLIVQTLLRALRPIRFNAISVYVLLSMFRGQC